MNKPQISINTMPMPKLFLTANFWFKMPRKLADKYNLGLSYILKLSLFHQCKSFSGGVTNWQDKLPQIKVCFENKVKMSWQNPYHLSVIEDTEAFLGKLFGKFLYPHSTLNLEELDIFLWKIKTSIVLQPLQNAWSWPRTSCCCQAGLYLQTKMLLG